MDIVLEIADNYLFDRAYSTLLPKSYRSYIPETPEFFTNAWNTINNSTNAAAISLSNSKYPLLNNLINFTNPNSVKEIYGYNSKYHFFDENSFTNASLLSRNNIIRQTITLFIVTSIFGWLLYFIVAYLSYKFVYDKTNFNHPRYLKNQVFMEIKQASTAIPIMVLLTIPWFLLELHGYSKLYYNIDESTGGWKSILLQFPSFILFTDCGIYFIHRALHWPSLYKNLHKPHHKWIVCTPFASHAFHPVDGYLQSLPYHIFPFFFPLHKISYLFLFTFVNFWTVMIHDGEYLSNDPVVNGAACHTIHHLYFNYNYGQFTTLWDRLGGSYRKPDYELFDKNKRIDQKTWAKQSKLMDEIRKDVEGKDDDRVYINTVEIKKTQ
ncbi:c-5 sterol desaturase [Pichia californica]|uniref:C-5 sterol desaturase n=1 Tax=Pichia californica TaxID=460514 RepID=A0A9P7BHT8_9ASCO|nr:c-5 sterol desaturase [[Candida] californica]KAG0690499.1 c-5 sterol desaturase [[Candida] californica]